MSNQEESNSMPEDSQKEPSVGDHTEKLIRKRPNGSRPVTVYLGVLFVAALLLLLMSFFMQQRNQQALEDLNQSMEDSQSITSLKLEKQKLEFDLTEMKKDLTAAEESKTELETKVQDLEKQNQALEWLRQIEKAAQISHGEAKKLSKVFQESGLDQYLPTESVVEGQDSPADTYREIYAMLY